jgi:hypothetical protein
MPDPILLWNEVALEANRVSHTNVQGEQGGPPLSARALAIVHLAMYDAYAGVVGGPDLPLYCAPPPSKSGLSPDAAVAGAAHETLSKLFPSQMPFFDRILQAAGSPGDAHDYGVDVAKKILADRKDDPGVGSATYKVSSDRCRHRPDPDNPTQGIHAPDYGWLSKGFGITDRFELARPPCDNDEYRTALAQVRAKGIKPELLATLPTGAKTRTVDETVIGIYWAYDGALQLGTPPRLYNKIIRAVAVNKPNPKTRAINTPAENARLFAFVNVAMADAGILAWDQKYIYDLWRPVVGIREHDPSTGPASMQPGQAISGDADPFWLPLGAPNSNRLAKNFTPPFPAYPSGHATFGAAAFHITRLFYGQGGTLKAKDLGPDTLFAKLDFVSEELNGVTTDNTGAVRPRHRRTFPQGLWQMIGDNGLSRVYLGVHWIFDAFAVKKGTEVEPDLYRQDGGKYIGGVPLGLLIAEDVFTAGGGKAPKKSSVGPRPARPTPAAGQSPTYSSQYLR